ncbi:AAA family ATPase [Flavobacterium faecale]|uniref:AAA family ATPase n=1 Tax=Flavobacterium faecale TaxID=1355330 RepID=UPI003AAE2B35
MDNQTKTVFTTELKLKNTSFDIYETGGNYINQIRLFHAYFETIPNIKSIRFIEITAMRKWILAEMKNDIQQQHYYQTYEENAKKNFYSDHFFILKNGIVINLFYKQAYILFKIELEKEAQELQNQLLQFKVKPKKTTQISLIVNSNKGFTSKSIEIKKPKLDLNLHYNDDFKNIHQLIIKNIRKPNTKGLFLFHGLPGTGKSTYIKYLIHQQKKDVIFLSPKMASNLDDMALTEFLLENRNCILVIEDAEELILSRDNHHNSKLSFLLNLTDGLLGESLGIQIIATFNTDLKNIDKALLRKGRLTSIYEFRPLSVDKSNILLKSLGHEIEINNPLALTDIFNFEIDNNYQPKIRKAVGFGN